MLRERIPHAYLFTGMSGVGKTSMAKAMTMALNCREPSGLDACGRCPPCRQMSGGNFPDFVCIKPDGQNIKIDQIRELNRKLGFPPVSAKYRVCVICQAEAMNTEASNSFLKSLEEPPPGNVFVLNTTEPLDLLPTTVSRCQRVSFQPLPVKEITDWLIKEKALDLQSATIIAKASSGSLGRAINMCQDGFLEKRQKWISDLIQLPRLSNADALGMALDSVPGLNKGGLAVSDGGGTGSIGMLDIWETWYRDLLVVRVGGPDDLVINADFSEELKNLAGSSRIERLINSILVIDRAQKDLHRMRNNKLVMEHAVISLQRLVGASE